MKLPPDFDITMLTVTALIVIAFLSLVVMLFI